MGWRKEPVRNPAAEGDLPRVGCAGKSFPAGRSILSHQPPVLPAFPNFTFPGRWGQAGRAQERWAGRGRGIQGCSHGLLTAQREERSRRRQSCASCLATPLQISILSENVFPSDLDGVFTGTGSGLDDQVVLRDHTLYLEGQCTRFDQKLD